MPLEDQWPLKKADQKYKFFGWQWQVTPGDSDRCLWHCGPAKTCRNSANMINLPKPISIQSWPSPHLIGPPVMMVLGGLIMSTKRDQPAEIVPKLRQVDVLVE